MKKLAVLLAATLVLGAGGYAWGRTAHIGKPVALKNLLVNGDLTVTGTITPPLGMAIKDTGNDHTITLAASSNEAANRTVSFPALGGNAAFVMTVAAQTIAGVKTFSSAPVVPDGSFARTKLATTSGAEYPIDLQSKARNDDGTTIAASASAGKFGVTNGTHSAPGLKLVSEAANSNTKTDYASVLVTLPPEYVAAGNLTCTVTVDLEGSGTAGTNTIDVTAYEIDTSGAAGSDICATAAANLAASPTARAFTITGTDLVAGDKVMIYFTMVVQESAGTNLNGAITNAKVAFDIKG